MMKRYKKKVHRNDVIYALGYLYLSNRYSILLNLHKHDETVSSALKMQWVDKYVESTIQYNIKALEIFKENNIQTKNLVRFEFNLEEELLNYCLKEIDVEC